MKDNIRSIYNIVFVFCLPLTMICFICGLPILVLFRIGVIPGTSETLHEFLVLLMLASPVGIGITFSKPVFKNIIRERAESKPEFSGFLKWITSKVDTTARVTYETKTFFARIYATHYTTFFRWFYALFSLFMLMTTINKLPLVYSNEAVAILIATSLINFGLMTMLCSMYWTATRNQISTN